MEQKTAPGEKTMLLLRTYALPALLLLIVAVAGAQNIAASGRAPVSPELAAPAVTLLDAQRLKLEAALQEYQIIAMNGGWPEFPSGKSIRPGQRDPRVPALREILKLTCGAPAAPESHPDLLDPALQKAVKCFQKRHGLDADGAAGKRTQEALAVSVEDRIAQMQATLTRMQEFRPESPRLIVVNLPAYTLYAIDGDTLAFTSRVIVGDTKNRTPRFENAITQVNFNPAWNVPHRIAVEEIAAKERNNPGYIQRSGLALIDSSGGRVNPEEVDWDSVGRRNFPYRLRQPPGAGNALGKIKFTLPDNDSIYLHSTSRPQLFAKSDRALSHGCVRVEEARKLAYFVMEGTGDWTPEKIDKAYDGSASRTVTLEQPVPVHVVYWTSFVDEDGEVNFRPDVYGLDREKIREASLQQDLLKIASRR